ncbi:MAG: gamma-glutamylcyclotransferase [Planctomycetaceae bacterium]|nr:gamma-glutamylcyclotransferase [Planctomycetaceae bacterium]
MPTLPLFVFGTLRRGECNHHYLAETYDSVITARLHGFARVEPLMIARQTGSAVDGELFFLTAATYSATLRECDSLEELPRSGLIGHEYRRIAVRVQTDSGEFIAWAYSCPDAESDLDLLPLITAESQRLIAER